ncbi:Translin [Hysterangium stoloniferum]|nr:Translin [Hysterangium stoloniferum]
MTANLSAPNRPQIVDAFDAFRQEFDDHNDRRERLIKLSRDVTNLSKKVIFLLHRLALEAAEDDEQKGIDHAVYQSRQKLAEIGQLFEQMSIELQGENFWRYQKTVSPGLQEYIEALSFAQYLESKTLLSFQQVQDNLRSPAGVPYFPLGVPYADYLLGISDLTGELMRFAITSIGRQGMISQKSLDEAVSMCKFVRDCKSGWEPMTAYIKELKSKQDVTTSCLKKIEEGKYFGTWSCITRSL